MAISGATLRGLNSEPAVTKRSEVLGYDPLNMQSPSNLSIKDYTEIIYVIFSGDVPSRQCKMSVHRSISEGQMDGLNLISNHFVCVCPLLPPTAAIKLHVVSISYSKVIAKQDFQLSHSQFLPHPLPRPSFRSFSSLLGILGPTPATFTPQACKAVVVTMKGASNISLIACF
jgi:hypothetical protein